MQAYVKQERKTIVLPKGWQRSEGKRSLDCAIINEENVTFKHRDGVKSMPASFVRTDEKVPAILALSPYGKGGHGFHIYENSPFRLGIPLSATSGLEKFESPDPAEWAPRGYAVVNVDIRGTWESEGNLYIEGTQPGRDAYDLIQAVAQLDWCNGSISMAGNSWLATTQWSAAIQKPPALKCIAPWEGFTDMYRDVACRGGIPKTDFVGFIFDKTIRGRQKREDVAKALGKWPLMRIHVAGTFRGWTQARSKNKWLRVHSTQEWFDLYTKQSNDDLQLFFDRYLKNVDNDWEKTPKVRVSVLTYGSRSGTQPIVDIPFTNYPPENTKYQKLFLTASKKLGTSPEDSEFTVDYESDSLQAEPADFVHIFDKPTKLIDYPRAKLWMSCPDTDELDIYLSLRKVDQNGKVLEHINIPWKALPEGVNSQEAVPNANTIKHLGPSGVLRASHRAKDPSRSSEAIPWHAHDKEEKVPQGTVVPVDIGIWPMGIAFEKGEGLILRVQGHLDQCVEFINHINQKPKNLNKGKHIIHVGGKYESALVVPIVEG
ncbi:alpha/beta-hydrolase [Tothia fuscella]|uniref:Alpha/beta-hydrolase n=1 Tax=Tothia fuscella TaxID=1048955 RepID=A0A9P4NE41_9PEZI|nr:alpha/beta-hydrolase [Tothia fuscella]